MSTVIRHPSVLWEASIKCEFDCGVLFLFNVGDKVVMRDDLVIGEVYGGLTLLGSMRQDCIGKVLEVEKVDMDEGGKVQYCLISGSHFCYTADMFLPYWSGKELIPPTRDELLKLFAR